MTDFLWRDGERKIRFGRGALADAGELLGEPYALLTTERARAGAPDVVDRAAEVHILPAGEVGDLAADLLPRVGPLLVVGLGGGRVVDTAKAITGAREVDGARAGAIPTTISAAEMTAVHRPAAVPGAGFVRAAIVINDPLLSGSQPGPDLAASAANSLAHAVEGAVTTKSSPVPTLAAREAQRLIDSAYLVEDESADPGPMAREQLALGALLSGYAIDSAHYGLHHVLAQTLRLVGGIGHGRANAVLLPHTIAALEEANPGRVDPDGTLAALAQRLRVIAGAESLRALGVEEAALEQTAERAARRAELALTPPARDAGQLLEILRRAW